MKQTTTQTVTPSHSGSPVRIKSGDDMTIRPASAADVPLILTMVRELADYEQLLHEVIATEADFHDSLFGDGNRAEALIADVDDAPVAMAIYYQNFSSFIGRHGLYVEDLYVRPAWRGRGIGKALLSRLAAVACDRGCVRMEWTVLDWNQPAIDVYRAIGAVGMNAWRTQRLTGTALQTLAGRS